MLKGIFLRSYYGLMVYLHLVYLFNNPKYKKYLKHISLFRMYNLSKCFNLSIFARRCFHWRIFVDPNQPPPHKDTDAHQEYMPPQKPGPNDLTHPNPVTDKLPRIVLVSCQISLLHPFIVLFLNKSLSLTYGHVRLNSGFH